MGFVIKRFSYGNRVKRIKTHTSLPEYIPDSSQRKREGKAVDKSCLSLLLIGVDP